MNNFYHSATKVNTANYCVFRYYMRYCLKKKPLRLSVYVKGSLLHNYLEHFWDWLGLPEEVKSKSSKFKNKKYFDAESFAKKIQGKWTSIIIADEKSKEKIYWNSPDEKWFIKNDLKNIAIPLFDYLITQKKPLFIELPFDFVLENKRFKGKIDYIKRIGEKIILGDYKSGWPWVGDMKLKHDPQLTLYNVGFCTKLKLDKSFAKELGLEGKVEEFMAGQEFASPNLQEEFFMIEDLKKGNNPIYTTHRNDKHFLEVLKMIKGVERSISEGNIFPERGKKCDICDMKIHCDRELNNVEKGELIGKHGQLTFDFSVPFYKFACCKKTSAFSAERIATER